MSAGLTWTYLAGDHEHNSNPCSLSVPFNHSSTPHKAHRKKPRLTGEDYSSRPGSEPLVLITHMIHDQAENQLHASQMKSVDQAFHVRHRAIRRINGRCSQKYHRPYRLGAKHTLATTKSHRCRDRTGSQVWKECQECRPACRLCYL